MEVYVRGIHNADETDIKEHFKKFNPEKIRIIYDWKTKKNRGFAFVAITNNQKALAAIKELNGTILKGTKIKVNENNKKKDSTGPRAPRSKSGNHNDCQKNTIFPYTFVQRPKPEKEAFETFHNRLLPGHFDLAFEIAWTTVTPTAMNPCIKEGIHDCHPANNNGEYAGFSKRWLFTPDQRLCISPFTVKSAIANGFSNIMGSCYRVNTKIEKHPPQVTQGNYYYNGGYKRYRVAMDQSKPGILTADPRPLTENGKQYREITFKQVRECLYKEDGKFKPGEKYYAVKQEKKELIILSSVSQTKDPSLKNQLQVIYHGPYQFGMDNQLKPGELGKDYRHRFYLFEETKPQTCQGALAGLAQLKTDKDKGEIVARINEINFAPKETQAEKVYMGKFKILNQRNDPRKEQEGKFWYQNLSDLKKGDWIYYQPMAGKNVESLGKNFQFKAMFFHEDTVPQGQEACRDIKLLCPRCRLFGMSVSGQNSENEVEGVKGRFKSSTLVNSSQLVSAQTSTRIPDKDSKDNMVSLKVEEWTKATQAGNQAIICRQMFLPIQANPKPNKRDVNGYFDKKAGDLKGAKLYRSSPKAPKNLLELEKQINQTNSLMEKKNNSFIYAHHLRNWAQVCESGLDFSGVVGVENASKSEGAALLLLLETPLSGHGFKLGLGKAMGIGQINSRINKIWIRQSHDYEWELLPQENPVDKAIKKLDIKQDIDALKKAAKIIQAAERVEKSLYLGYPAPGQKYWKSMPETAKPEGL